MITEPDLPAYLIGKPTNPRASFAAVNRYLRQRPRFGTGNRFGSVTRRPSLYLERVSSLGIPSGDGEQALPMLMRSMIKAWFGAIQSCDTTTPMLRRR